MRSLFFRYGGISVGGRLPVLDVDPKSIQNAVGQIGRLLNVTGVNVSYCFHCEFNVIMFHIIKKKQSYSKPSQIIYV